MKTSKTRIHMLKSHNDLSTIASRGISLHCHTENSKEMLDFIPSYAEKLPIIAHFWRNESKKYFEREGKEIDFSSAFWAPPLSPETVHSLEAKQIENSGLEALVSITDHDCIGANLSLAETGKTEIPISLEWTVPFEYGFFHIGVHNLPKTFALELSETLIDFSFATTTVPDKEKLHELFEMLNAHREIVLVLNHPIWDIERVGQEKHESLLRSFLREFGGCLHALEINGFRSWSENKAVAEIAELFGIPLLSGGDRHGCQPNTVLNLSDCSSFAEFADEIRVDKHSEIVLMPEYRLPLHSRQLQSFAEILREFPNFEEGKQRWNERVYFDLNDGIGLASLAERGWVRGPLWLRIAIKVLGVMGSPGFRPLFELARSEKDRVPNNLHNPNFVLPTGNKKDFPKTTSGNHSTASEFVS
ncbi:MAG: PHP domain-containing protein [Pyrinomonadaceae bacterium]